MVNARAPARTCRSLISQDNFRQPACNVNFPGLAALVDARAMAKTKAATNCFAAALSANQISSGVPISG
jgi:hypothetical protein